MDVYVTIAALLAAVAAIALAYTALSRLASPPVQIGGEKKRKMRREERDKHLPAGGWQVNEQLRAYTNAKAAVARHDTASTNDPYQPGWSVGR